jgi:hypothetical protein
LFIAHCSLLIALCSLLLFLSCQTVPKTSGPLQGIIPLEPGAIVYIYADVQAARPVLELLPISQLKDKQAAQIFDKTRTVQAALYPPESGRRFQLAARGKYPSSQAALAFWFSKDWKKKRSHTGANYWYSQTERLSVAMSARQTYVSASLGVTTGDVPADPFSSGLQSPAEFEEAKSSSALACWLVNPGLLVDKIFASMNLPLQLPAKQIYISLFPLAGGKAETEVTKPMQKYEVLLCIETPSENQARLIANSMALLRLFSGAPSTSSPSADGSDILSALLLANAPVQDGSKLKIKSAPLSLQELALLFKQFSLYSSATIAK